MDRQFMTERLLMLPDNNKRDNDTFLEMLRKDGDFRSFSGFEPTEKNIKMFRDYLEINKSCFYTNTCEWIRDRLIMKEEQDGMEYRLLSEGGAYFGNKAPHLKHHFLNVRTERIKRV